MDIYEQIAKVLACAVPSSTEAFIESDTTRREIGEALIRNFRSNQGFNETKFREEANLTGSAEAFFKWEGGAAFECGLAPADCPYDEPQERIWWYEGYFAKSWDELLTEEFAGEIVMHDDIYPELEEKLLERLSYRENND